ncbi:uncharacterized protein LOC112010751 [Quercus suber]|uniref:DUF4220 domain-containing protein n=1 Tax=Quercus suber TaxID=58331 RepID=A0AAW0JYF4_QUESU|nr:uncharacterized protein LOC112010751 [Quercus suber]POE52688.1 hypothetical protein CFP56_17641 [Quercus suber]
MISLASLAIPNLKHVWDTWNVRVVILVSLTLQVILILVAPFRKRTTNKAVILSIWVSYLLADWAASFAVGHISSGSKESNDPCDKEDFITSVHYFFSSGKEKVSSCGVKGDALSMNYADILAFWAPFLLVHLGGPDTITAFALEDNELWLRHLFSLGVQLAITLYVFWLTFPKNKLFIPTLLMFAAGIIKYFERTRALFLASLGRFRKSLLKDPDPGPNYAKLMEEYSSKKDAGLPTKIEMTREPDKESKLAANVRESGNLSEIEVVTYAYRYFQKFKGLIVDIIFSYRERNESRDFFLNRNAEDALKLIELELNFIYEAFYTKVLVVHSLTGYIFRLISIVLVLVAYGLFYSLDKHDFKKFDIIVTYTLLFGAMSLDGIALIMLISSDWTIAVINTNKTLPDYVSKFVSSYLSLKSLRWCVDPDKIEVLDTSPILRRWSESVSSFNLIAHCLEQRPRADRGRIRRFIDSMDYFGVWDNVTDFFFPKTNLYPTKKLPKNLWSFIFDELTEKSKDAADAETTKSICSARGAYAIQGDVDPKITGDYIQNIAYDESLLLWHVATDLCYWKGLDAPEKEGDNTCWSWRFVTELFLRQRPDKAKTIPINENRHFSKLLSDYMIYLLVKLPNMMSAVTGIGQIRYRDTCVEAENFFSRRGIKQGERKACLAILAVNTEVKPVYVKGDRSKSILFDASMLAKELEKLDDHKRWQIIIKVWVEMLSYAASHCRPDTHAKEVSKGGQLISFVWLLMAHFGLGEQFQINEGHTRAKLIVDK